MFRYFLILIKRKLFRKRYLIILVFLSGFYFYGQLFQLPDGKLHVRFLDVGQGDATLITTAGGSNVLIDGGPNNKVLGLVNQFIPSSDRRIDLLFLSHPDADHVSGLVPVLKSYDVKNIVYEPFPKESKIYKEFLSAVEEEKRGGAKVTDPNTGDVISIGDLKLKVVWSKDAQEEVLGASTGVSKEDFLDSKKSSSGSLNSNDVSLVLKVTYQDLDVLLTGDESNREADAMMSQSADLESIEVYKAAHHGSKNGFSEALLGMIKPSLTVISVGRNNSYGHPYAGLLDYLYGVGIRVLRTDLNGTIDVVSDGKSWGIK